MSQKKGIMVWLAFLLMLPFSLRASVEAPCLHLYVWHEYIPHQLIKEFEAESGIQVIVDVYDSNDMLEAKLLTGASGYDLVCPSAWPYAGLQIQSHIYQPLRKELLPNLRHLDPFVMAKLENIDPGNQYIVPYMWGVIGLGYNKRLVKQCYPEAKTDSLAMLFDETHLKKLSKCGISLLDEAVDVIPLVLLYLGFDPNTQTPQELQEAGKFLEGVVPYISRFGVYQPVQELGTGDLCVVLGCSVEIRKAMEIAYDTYHKSEIEFFIPKEGTSMWVDVWGIPNRASHPQNAHQFINFLLKPDVSARASQMIFTATANKKAWEKIPDHVRKDSTIYVCDAVKDKLYVDQLLPQEIVRLRSRIWLDAKSGRAVLSGRHKKEGN